MTSYTRFDTPNAARFLTKLCEHFGRKVEAQETGGAGWVQFPFGRCEMKAASDHLEFRASAPSAEGLAMVVQVVTSHLERYAFRENPLLDWSTAPE
ncbi:MAG: DUF2218 domain-containing protein [Pseudomonadota bacterium]